MSDVASAITTNATNIWSLRSPASCAIAARMMPIAPRAFIAKPTALASRSRNTPYAGRTLTGQVRHTVLAGEPVVVDAVAQR